MSLSASSEYEVDCSNVTNLETIRFAQVSFWYAMNAFEIPSGSATTKHYNDSQSDRFQLPKDAFGSNSYGIADGDV